MLLIVREEKKFDFENKNDRLSFNWVEFLFREIKIYLLKILLKKFPKIFNIIDRSNKGRGIRKKERMKKMISRNRLTYMLNKKGERAESSSIYKKVER